VRTLRLAVSVSSLLMLLLLGLLLDHQRPFHIAIVKKGVG